MTFRSALLIPLFTFLGVFLVITMICDGCTPAATPREQARSVILTIADGVHQADLTCSVVAKDDRNLELAKKCATYVATAREALLIAESGIDAWEQGTSKNIPCAMRSAVDALSRLLDTLSAMHVDHPPAVDDALRLAPMLTGACRA